MKTVCKAITPTNIAKQWFDYSRERDDFTFSFISKWVSFNSLYGASDGTTERAQIRSYCEENRNFLNKYDPFSEAKEHISIFLDAPILDMRTHQSTTERDDCYKVLSSDKPLEKKLYALIKSIYWVRCNLFHGSKSFMNDRDMALVKASSMLMDGFLTVLIYR